MGSILCGIPAINKVNFVKLYKPALAKKAVHQGFSLFVLLENGNVATNHSVVRNACFMVNKSASSFWQFYEVVQALRKLGVISKDDKTSYRKMYEEAFVKEHDKNANDYFVRDAKKLGITLTPTQKKLLKSKRHAKKQFNKKAPK